MVMRIYILTLNFALALQNLKYFTIWSFQENFANFFSKAKTVSLQILAIACKYDYKEPIFPMLKSTPFKKQHDLHLYVGINMYNILHIHMKNSRKKINIKMSKYS